MIIKLDRVKKYFNKNLVLKGVNLKVDEGERVVIAGPNGSGKTTLLRVITLLIEPESGEIELFGFRNPRGRRGIRLRRRMAIVRQNPIVFRGSVQDNILFPLKLRGIKGKEALERSSEALSLTGLEGKKGANVRDLSGGEVRRLAWARAIALHADLYIFDEATSGIDSEFREVLIDHLRKIEGTFIFTTHIPEEAGYLGERLVVMRDGTIEEDRQFEEVFHSPETTFSARFTGYQNIIGGIISKVDDYDALFISEIGSVAIKVSFSSEERLREGDRVFIAIPASNIVLAEEPMRSSIRNILEGRVVNLFLSKGQRLIQVDVKGNIFNVLITEESVRDLNIAKDKKVCIGIKATGIRLIR